MESAKPATGHNSSELTEAEKSALLQRGISELQKLLEEKAEVETDIKNERKRILSYGFSPFEIKYALTLRKGDEAEMVERRRAEMRIAKFLNHPIGVQADMFDQPDRTPDVDKAFDAGFAAGAAGQSAQPPFALGMQQEQAWLRGWHQAQDTLASAFKKLEVVAPAEDGQGDIERVVIPFNGGEAA